MVWSGSSDEYAAFVSPWPVSPDPEIEAWRERLEWSTQSVPLIRQALPTGGDARRLWDLQLFCPPITVWSIADNVRTIEEHRVLLAEVEGVHVGFCVSLPGARLSDPLFVQVIAVAPPVQRRGIGLALLTAAAKQDPKRDIALATRLDNAGARAMNASYAQATGRRIRPVKLGTYPHRALGFTPGNGYRIWVIDRPETTS